MYKRPLKRRQFIACLAVLPVAMFATPGQAHMPMFFAPGGLAINGFDPVAYFTDAKPVPGRPDQAVMWKGAIWRFASQFSRELFESNPRAFAPQYGGYCAYALSIGETSITDPMAWAIHANQLFLTHDLPTRRFWLRDITGNITRANRHWPGVLHHA